MKRNLDRHNFSIATASDRSIWRSPIVYFMLALLATAIIFPIFLDAQQQSIISALYIDVSASNQPFQKQIKALCQERLTYLRSRDVMLDARFADRTVMLPPELYKAHNQANLQQRCGRIFEINDGVGKRPGTSFSLALTNLKSQIRQLRSRNNHDRIVAVFLLQATESVPGQPAPNWKAIKQQLKEITDDQSAVLIMGAAAELQQQLDSLLEDIPNVQVSSYPDGSEGLQAIFETVRKS